MVSSSAQIYPRCSPQLRPFRRNIDARLAGSRATSANVDAARAKARAAHITPRARRILPACGAGLRACSVAGANAPPFRARVTLAVAAASGRRARARFAAPCAWRGCEGARFGWASAHRACACASVAIGACQPRLGACKSRLWLCQPHLWPCALLLLQRHLRIIAKNHSKTSKFAPWQSSRAMKRSAGSPLEIPETQPTQTSIL